MEEIDRDHRWRLLIGKDQDTESEFQLDKALSAIDDSLEFLYRSQEGKQQGSLDASSPRVARWLGDIRSYFPTTVVRALQKDAFKRLNLTSMLLEPELLTEAQPDVNLVATILSLSSVMPAKTKETARIVVQRVVEDLLRRLSQPMEQAVRGSLNKSVRTRRPRHNEINWHETIKRNLKHYQPEYKTIIPETRIGFGRRRSKLKDVILCIDQSGSMGTSVVYSSIFGAVMASIPALSTRLVVFDTAVVDLTENLTDPVDILFGVQLGGGTDIARALTYCKSLVTRPSDTVLVLITDLYEGGDQEKFRATVAELVGAGVRLVCLLALNDEGAPFFDKENAAFLASRGVPSFACTPDRFPDVMAAALQDGDVTTWKDEG